MFLKSLEMQGFKSFPDKTVLEFGQGITGVVGPNGSGKSNIADAVRWVLGEQSSKNLRGSKMEDVVFGGTGERKAKGFAEVTLRLDNSDRALNCDKDEVSVTRRYYRSGESEYLLNNEICRLKDVNEMFMDTGLGRDGYSMVSQGRVADMISSKSGQRREMLEEAAGISHYRYRRTDATRRLAAAEENMVRLRDILTELEGRVGPLKVQSEKATKFIALAAERKTLEIGLWLHSVKLIRQQLKTQEDKLNIASSSYENVVRELTEIADEIEKSIEASGLITAQIDEKRAEASSLEEQAVQADSEAALQLGAVRHNGETIDRITREMEAAVLSKQSLDDEITEQMKLIELLRKSEADKQKELEEAGEKIDEILAKSRDYTQKIAQLNDEIAQISLETADCRVEMSTAESSVAEINSRMQAIDDIFLSRSEAVKSLEKVISDSEAALDKRRKEAVMLENAVKGYSMKVRSREEKAQALNDEISNLSLDIDRRASRAKVLEDLEKNMEGYSQPVKAVMCEVKRGTLSGIHGVLSQLISVEDEYTVAVETALGGALQNIVTQNENDAKRAINFLKNSNSGRATFLPVSALAGKRTDEKGLEDCYGYVAIAEDLVSCDEQYRGIITNLLGRTVVAEDMDCAIMMSKKYSRRLRIVTLDGQLINPGGSMTGGSRTHNSGILSRASEIDKLNKECLSLNNQLTEKKEALRTHMQDLAKCKADEEATRADLARLQEEIIRAEGELQSSISRLNDTKASITDLEKEKSSSGERIAALKRSAEAAAKKAKELTKRADALREEVRQAELASSDLDQDELSARKNESRLRLDLLAIKKDIEARQETVNSLHDRVNGHGAKLEDLSREIAEIAENSKAIKESIAEFQASAQSLREKAALASEEADRLSEKRKENDAKSALLRQTEREKNDEKEKLGGEVARLEERKAVLEKNYEDTVAKLYDEYQLTLREAGELNIDLGDPAEARRNLNEIKSKIKALGNVNVSAIDEYKEVSERYEYMKAQITDVEKSMAELEKLIRELTAKMSQQFREGFVKINRCFGETFSELFDGGRAELILEDERDALECQIDIKVQPPGKRVQNIDLLSGGEKGLSAIALLFAILKVSPAPFCFFDEVEAALDDVNVLRYAKYVRRMTGNTQFILITHRRGTMEEADILYGVTMQEKGVSKLLELKTSEMAKKLGID